MNYLDLLKDKFQIKERRLIWEVPILCKSGMVDYAYFLTRQSAEGYRYYVKQMWGASYKTLKPFGRVRTPELVAKLCQFPDPPLLFNEECRRLGEVRFRRPQLADLSESVPRTGESSDQCKGRDPRKS